MAGRRVSHSESRWAQLPDTVIWCNGTLQSGKRCRREAIEGSEPSEAFETDQMPGQEPQRSTSMITRQ
jgi:hypothetical protein